MRRYHGSVLVLVLVTAMWGDRPLAMEQSLMNELGADGHIAHWLLLGPFSRPATTTGGDRAGYDHDYLTGLGTESWAVINADTVLVDGDDRWTAARPERLFDNGLLLHAPFDRQVGYACALIRCRTGTRACCYLSSDGSPQVWCNGERIIAGWRREHKSQAYEYAAWVDLQAGINRLLVKIDNRRGWWGFQASLFAARPHASSSGGDALSQPG